MNPQRDREIARALGWDDKNFPVLSTWIGMGTLATTLDEMFLLKKIMVDQYDLWKKKGKPGGCFTHRMLDPDRFADEVHAYFKRDGRSEGKDGDEIYRGRTQGI
jgi:hypothetical protein